jgi:hypothetical protein
MRVLVVKAVRAQPLVGLSNFTGWNSNPMSTELKTIDWSVVKLTYAVFPDKAN